MVWWPDVHKWPNISHIKHIKYVKHVSKWYHRIFQNKSQNMKHIKRVKHTLLIFCSLRNISHTSNTFLKVITSNVLMSKRSTCQTSGDTFIFTAVLSMWPIILSDTLHSRFTEKKQRGCSLRGRCGGTVRVSSLEGKSTDDGVLANLAGTDKLVSTFVRQH